MDPPRRPGAAGGTAKPGRGGSRGLPGPRPPRHLEWLPAAAAPAWAVAAAGGRSVVPLKLTTPTVEAWCVPATCVQIAYTVSSIVSGGEKGRGGRGRQGQRGAPEGEGARGARGARRRGKKAAGGCSATCVQLAKKPGHQGAERYSGSGRVASHIALHSARQGGRVRAGTERQKARDPEARKEGQGRVREDEQTRGKTGPGSRSGEGERRGRVASQIAPHRARARRRAEGKRWRRGERGVLARTSVCTLYAPGC